MSRRDFYGKSLFLWAAALIAVALAGAAGVGLVRDYGRMGFLKLEPPRIPSADASLAAEWLNAVSSKDVALKSVCLTARRIVPESDSFSMPDKQSCKLVSSLGVRLGFLTDPFNFADCARWRDLVELKAIADGIEGAEKSPEPLFKAVLERLGRPNETASQAPSLSILDPWLSGAGSVDDRIRLLCALAWQAGYGCRLLGIYERSGRPVGTLVMLSKDGSLWLASCSVGAIWPCKGGKLDFLPVENYLSAEQRSALSGPFVRYVPTEPQDFRPANIALYSRLAASGAKGKGLPRLPEEPQKAMAALSKELGSGDVARFWPYPFAALASSKDVPASWLVPLPANAR